MLKHEKVISSERKMIIIGITFILLFVTMSLSIVTGTVHFSFWEFIACINGDISSGHIYQIINNIRIPRVITGMLVGMNLAVAGVLLQGILRNPMASPNIIGVNSGASLMAVILMALIPSKILFVPIAAFFGALVASLLIFLLSMQRSGKSSAIQIVLAGVAVSSLLNSLSSGIMIINSDVLDVTYSWMLGSLSGRSWSAVYSILPYSLVGLSAAIYISPKVNLFVLGDDMAASIGLKTNFHKVIIIVISSILAGSAVSAAGAIGFVGLIAPHTARMIIGGDHKYLVPLSALLGSMLLIISDMVARTLFQPVELSVGVVTSVLGAPFFLLLLIKSRNKHLYT